MKHKKPVPIEINKIIIGEKYYTCSWTGAISVIVLKIFNDTNSVLVIIKKWRNPLVKHGSMMNVNEKRNRYMRI